MKKLVLIFAAIFSLGLFFGCETDLADAVLDIEQSTPPAFTSPSAGSTFDLAEFDPADTVMTLQWSPAQYNVPNLPNPRYVIQMAEAGTDFATMRELAAVRGNSFAVTQELLNARMTAMGFEPGEPVDIQLRLFASISDNAVYENMMSAPVTITVVPFEAVIAVPSLWVPGDYQGWAPDAAPTIFSPADDGVYRGYVHMPGGSGEFKFTSEPSWGGINYGSAGAGQLSTDGGASNLSVPNTGTWYFVANINDLTWTQELRNYALVGNLTDWGGQPDLPLEWDATNRVFTITTDFPANAEFKFRANSAWDVDLGQKRDGEPGILAYGGANIVIENPGTYTIILNLYRPVPTYEIIPQ